VEYDLHWIDADITFATFSGVGFWIRPGSKSHYDISVFLKFRPENPRPKTEVEKIQSARAKGLENDVHVIGDLTDEIALKWYKILTADPAENHRKVFDVSGRIWGSEEGSRRGEEKVCSFWNLKQAVIKDLWLIKKIFIENELDITRFKFQFMNGPLVSYDEMTKPEPEAERSGMTDLQRRMLSKMHVNPFLKKVMLGQLGRHEDPANRARRVIGDSVDKGMSKSVSQSVDEAMFSPGKKISVLVPVYVEWIINDMISGVEDFVNDLENAGFDADWIIDNAKRFQGSDDFDDGEGEEEGEESSDGEGEEEGEEKDIDDAFDEYLEDQFGGRWNRFVDEIVGGSGVVPAGSSGIDESDISGAVDAAVEDFNSENMAQYLDADRGGPARSVTMEGPIWKDGHVMVKVVGDFDNPTEKTEELFRGWVEGQMSDGWGEGYEQNNEEKINSTVSYSIKFHSRESETQMGPSEPTPSRVRRGLTTAKDKVVGAVKKIGDKISGGKLNKVGKETGRRIGKAFKALRGESKSKGVIESLVK
jgi:hypothetical protein